MVMVMLDKQDYLNKAFNLLADKDAYRLLLGVPTNRIRKKSLKLSRPLRHKEDLVTLLIKGYPTSVVPLNFYGLPKIEKCGIPPGPLFLGGVPLYMEWQRSWPTSSDYR